MKHLTAVRTTFLEGELNRRIVAGTPAHTETHIAVHGRTERTEYFPPGSLFVLDYWARNEYGTRDWRVIAARTIAPGEPGVTVPYVRPGVALLADIRGPHRCPAFLRWLASHGDQLDAIGAAGLQSAGAFFATAPRTRLTAMKKAKL